MSRRRPSERQGGQRKVVLPPAVREDAIQARTGPCVETRDVLQTEIDRPSESDVVGAYACDRCPALFSRKASLKRQQDTSCCGRWDANEEQGDGVWLEDKVNADVYL
ncbi:hypothetical protein EW146_g9974 [Bondarzewia mesenterica]|uniref:C2H2-type domain-containing protein n=1 Tax=Bondarzewia mesenterica TaxID=1095465 RepID=A0A4S4L1I5_9AGAM|nr:hypothetical protein EW146_g9974 [Bondarzewia mesenterica]